MADLLQVRALTVRRAGRPVVTGVDLAVPEGSVTGLIGPNGAGKSTLMAAIGGRLPYEGSIRLAGQEVASDPWAARRAARTAFVPSRANAGLTGTDYLRFLRAHRRAAYRPDAAERLTRALGLDTALDRRIGTYSRGTARKLALLAAFAFETPLVLLDETLDGLDHGALLTARAFVRAEAATGRSVLLASHAASHLSEWCDTVMLMREGGVAGALPGEPAGAAPGAIRDAIEALYATNAPGAPRP